MSDEKKGTKAAEQEEPLVITNEELADLDQTNKSGNGRTSEPTLNEPTLIDFLASVPFELVGGATKLAAKTVEFTFNAGRSLLQPERLEMMAETGRYVREMRELAGLTIDELAEALNLEDNTVLEAVEKGTATLSFELILRLREKVLSFGRTVQQCIKLKMRRGGPVTASKLQLFHAHLCGRDQQFIQR